MKCIVNMVSLILLSGLISSCHSPDSKVDIKNVIVLIGDDHSAGVVGCYGNDIIKTPNIDRLAAEGTLFLNAYSNAPVCSASRQSLLTGKYPHATGVTLLTTPFSDDGNVTLAEYLREFGYSTGVVGKTHFNNWTENPPDHGFSTMIGNNDYKEWLAMQHMKQIPDSIKVLPKWRPFVDSARIWLNADMLPTAVRAEYGSAAFDAAEAIQFLGNNKDNPFLLWVGFHEPHSPFNFPIEYTGKYDPEKMPLPGTSPEDDRFVPAIFRNLAEADKRGIIASYYTSVEYLDYNVGKILNAVDSLDLAENTLVIYLGDQGYLLGDHKRFEKHTMWDPAIKAPLIFRIGSAKQKIKKSDALVQFIDIVPTILDILGMPPLSSVQGKNVSYVFNSRAASGDGYVFAEFLEDNKAMVTDGKWKYVFTTGKYDLGQGYETGEGPSGILHKLYDLQNDPEESTNVADFPGNEMILHSLQNEMIKIFRETYPGAENISDTLAVEEQLILFCEPPDQGAKRGVK